MENIDNFSIVCITCVHNICGTHKNQPERELRNQYGHTSPYQVFIMFKYYYYI